MALEVYCYGCFLTSTSSVSFVSHHPIAANAHLTQRWIQASASQSGRKERDDGAGEADGVYRIVSEETIGSVGGAAERSVNTH